MVADNLAARGARASSPTILTYRNVPIRSDIPNRSAPPNESAHCHGIVAPTQNRSAGRLKYELHSEFIHTYTAKHGTCCSKSQWWPPKHVSLLLACLNHQLSKHTISAPVMPKTVRNRSALHDVLAQGASNRDITVIILEYSSLCTTTG